MNTSAEAADQIVRMSLNGAEMALKISGEGAKEVAKLIYKVLLDMSKQTKRTKGHIRLTNLIQGGKQLDIYAVDDQNLKKFCQEAKKYGILYTILKDRNINDGKTEIMVKAEDKQKIDHIYDKLNLAPFSIAQIKEDAEKDPLERPAPEKSEEDKFLDKLLSKPNQTKDDGQTKNPTQARTANVSQSEPSSKAKSEVSKNTYKSNPLVSERKSVRKELSEIKEERKRVDNLKSQIKTAEHKIPHKKKNDKQR